jgi:hypothetical protein
MNQDFSEMMILPPYNTVHAQVIQRGEEPKIITSGIQVDYVIPTNTTSVNKTNFWTYAPDLFGVTLPPDIGLTGNGLKGLMTAEPAAKDWIVTGIPLTPINDKNQLDPYSLATITATKSGKKLASSQAVVPVSWEISCDICHNTPGISVATDILRAHDRLHGTSLESQKPVVCGSCHAQPPLGLAGAPGVPSLSSSMHSAHATRMAQANLAVECYACHPGFQTQCLRDIHYKKGFQCTDCHGSMHDVGAPTRISWKDEPRCGDCHNKKGHTYEQANTLFRDSKGHHGVSCSSCHGSPHAITPTVDAQDNVQAIALQGHAGTIDTCTVCHTQKPDDNFDHVFNGSGGEDKAGA